MADDLQYEYTPGPHPYLLEPILYISNLAPYVTETDLSFALEHCVPYRPRIPRDDQEKPLSGTIEFKLLEKGTYLKYNLSSLVSDSFLSLSTAEKALATLQGRPVPGVSPPALIRLSPYPPTHPSTLPAPSALPRIVKQLPPDFTDSQLYDLFRPFGPLASVRTQVGFGGGKDTAIVEFWREEDAKAAEENLHCAEVGGQNIAVQVYHPPKRTSGSEFSPSPSAPPFIPSGSVAGPYSQQVRLQSFLSFFPSFFHSLCTCRALLEATVSTAHAACLRHSFMAQASKCSSLRLRVLARVATAA